MNHIIRLEMYFVFCDVRLYSLPFIRSDIFNLWIEQKRKKAQGRENENENDKHWTEKEAKWKRKLFSYWHREQSTVRCRNEHDCYMVFETILCQKTSLTVSLCIMSLLTGECICNTNFVYFCMYSFEWAEYSSEREKKKWK